MSNIYLNGSYWKKLTFSNFDFSSFKNSFPGSFWLVLIHADTIDFLQLKNQNSKKKKNVFFLLMFRFWNVSFLIDLCLGFSCKKTLLNAHEYSRSFIIIYDYYLGWRQKKGRKDSYWSSFHYKIRRSIKKKNVLTEGSVLAVHWKCCTWTKYIFINRLLRLDLSPQSYL